jgi:hypothetical protein
VEQDEESIQYRWESLVSVTRAPPVQLVSSLVTRMIMDGQS